MAVDPDALDLDPLLARLRSYEERAHQHAMDPHLPQRVLRQIDPGRRRLHARLAAAALALVLVGPLALHLRGRVAPAQAGPVEARRLYDKARGQKNAPWPLAVEAYRAVIRAASRNDRIRPRSLKAIAALYTKAELPHAALAARYAAARASQRSRSAPSSQLACARGLLRECDFEAARPLLEDIVTLGARRAPTEVASALKLLAQEAADRNDSRRLRTLATTMDEEGIPYPARIRARGDLGLLYLDAGAQLLAEQALQAARTLYARCLAKADEKTAREATRLWLDLPLRKALPAKRTGR